MEYYTKIVRDPKDIAEIDRLTRIIWDMQAEIDRLKKKLLWPVRQNPDDVLVRRIEILKDEMVKQQQDYEQKISELKKQLDKAVSEQNFERAAELRDEIKETEASK